MRLAFCFAACLAANAAQRFTADRVSERGIEVVRLKDSAHNVVVSIVPSLGNRAYELTVNGKNLLFFPADLEAYMDKGSPGLNGIPFLAPWGNRISSGGFWANGKRYVFNTDLGNLNTGQPGIAIHGMLTKSKLWQVTGVEADAKSANVTSKLEFWRYPELMANWPFAQTYEMVYRLSDRGLQVSITIKNLSAEPEPVVIGFHPYFNIPDVPRDECFAHIPARKHVETDSRLVATGQFTNNGLPDQISLRDHNFDDGFTDLIRNNAGEAVFSVQSSQKKIEVSYGPNYPVAIVYSPPGQNYICFEPMAAITNGINLAHDGLYPQLQTVAPSSTWQESFWISWTGF